MPLRATDQTHWCPEHRRSALGAAGLRRLDWERQPAAHLAGEFDRRGRELEARSRPRLVLSRGRHPSGTKRTKALAHPPQTHVRKKLEPAVPSGNQRAADFALNGQRVGELQESFWTAAWRLITRLESGLRSQGTGHKAPAPSTESE